MDVIDLEKIIAYLNKEKVLKVAGASLACLLAAYLGKIWHSYRFFKRLGIKTPKYQYFWGNFPELKKNKNYSDVLRRWTDEYGKTYGYYEGHLPVLVTSDLEIIEEICIKQYSNFSARKKAPIDRSDDSPYRSVFDATKTRWKRMRNIMNPTFSSVKLRELNPLMLKCSDRLVARLGQHGDSEINVAEFFKHYTMDTIWNCAFGVDTDTQNEAGNPYFKRSEEVFSSAVNMTIPGYLGTYFHEFKAWILGSLIFYSMIKYVFDRENVNAFFWIRNQIMDVFYNRLKTKEASRRDYMQLLIEARENKSTKLDINHNLKFSELHVEKRITDQEIQMNLVLFLLAGYETTSTALTYMFYVLATHPEEQEKLLHEIDEHFPHDSDAEPNLDKVQKLEYLDMFVKETLRMYPIGNSVITRRCVNPTNIKGIAIPLNLSIAVDVLSIHYNKELWGPEDPNEFYPLRFSPERKRHPMAYQAFGQGPRNCIGMKFALFEIKETLVKILRKFRVESTEKTEKTIEYVEGIVRSPKNGVTILLKKRIF